MRRKNSDLRERVKKHFERLASYSRMDSAWLDCDTRAREKSESAIAYFRIVKDGCWPR